MSIPALVSDIPIVLRMFCLWKAQKVSKRVNFVANNTALWASFPMPIWSLPPWRHSWSLSCSLLGGSLFVTYLHLCKCCHRGNWKNCLTNMGRTEKKTKRELDLFFHFTELDFSNSLTEGCVSEIPIDTLFVPSWCLNRVYNFCRYWSCSRCMHADYCWSYAASKFGKLQDPFSMGVWRLFLVQIKGWIWSSYWGGYCWKAERCLSWWWRFPRSEATLLQYCR